jgi:hypothetical protein
MPSKIAATGIERDAGGVLSLSTQADCGVPPEAVDVHLPLMV